MTVRGGGAGGVGIMVVGATGSRRGTSEQQRYSKVLCAIRSSLAANGSCRTSPQNDNYRVYQGATEEHVRADEEGEALGRGRFLREETTQHERMQANTCTAMDCLMKKKKVVL
mgnify:CR=1 FL=1